MKKKYSNEKVDRLFGVVNRLGIKMMLITLIIMVSSDIMIFTATIVVDMIGGGESNTVQILASLGASIIIGTLLAFIIGIVVLKPLSELIKGTKRVMDGDYSVRIDVGWVEKRTIRELRELIRDFNEMVEELQNTEMFRRDFISNFSHEFKTPLASIRGFARQLCEGDLTPEQQREFSKIILDETEYLSVMSQNTLLLTNLENRDIISERSERTEFSLDEQLRNCMLRLEPQWSEKNIEIDMEELEDVRFFWNEQLLAHVWNNLFDNAVKFTPEGGLIRVSCKRENGMVKIKVSDSGCGISADALPHIFEKFYQADNSHATNGNGLGLALAKKIVELCGGNIRAKSETGRGTTFYVELGSDVK